MKIIWVLVNCNTVKEAKTIGQKVLKERLSSCFDIIPRIAASYFWPPKSGKIESTKGCILIIETLPKYFKKIDKLARKLHSDKLPFIGSIEINNVQPDYHKWMMGEIKS